MITASLPGRTRPKVTMACALQAQRFDFTGDAAGIGEEEEKTIETLLGQRLQRAALAFDFGFGVGKGQGKLVAVLTRHGFGAAQDAPEKRVGGVGNEHADGPAAA